MVNVVHFGCVVGPQCVCVHIFPASDWQGWMQEVSPVLGEERARSVELRWYMGGSVSVQWERDQASLGKCLAQDSVVPASLCPGLPLEDGREVPRSPGSVRLHGRGRLCSRGCGGSLSRGAVAGCGHRAAGLAVWRQRGMRGAPTPGGRCSEGSGGRGAG